MENSKTFGKILDRDRLVYAHKDELILPAHLSKGIQSLIASSQNTLSYAPTTKES